MDGVSRQRDIFEWLWAGLHRDGHKFAMVSETDFHRSFSPQRGGEALHEAHNFAFAPLITTPVSDISPIW